MKAEIPSPQTTLVILLGASIWPNSPDFHPSKAFANSAKDFKQYLCDPHRFNLPNENILDLFDSVHDPHNLDQLMSNFLDRRILGLKQSGLNCRDILVYYVGHGGFTSHDEFFLSIRCTRAKHEIASGILIASLANTLKEHARFQRHLLILDCCFASGAVRYFQSTGLGQVVGLKIERAFKVPEVGEGFPSRGTSLLCSSSVRNPSRIAPNEHYTMFTEALLQALKCGDPTKEENLSLYTLQRLTEDYLRQTYQGKDGAPRPEVHSPDQHEGVVAFIPFFPNPALTEAEELRQKARTGQESWFSRERKGHVIISYASENREFAFKLAADLKNTGISLWMDNSTRVGDDWQDNIQRAIDSCACMIAVLSPSYTTSERCLYEINLAKSLKPPVPIFFILLQLFELQDWISATASHQQLDFRRWHDHSIYNTKLNQLMQILYEKSAVQIDLMPNREIRYLTSLIAELEARKGILEYVELSGITNVEGAEWPSEFALLKESLKRENSEKWRELEMAPFAHIGEAVEKYSCFALVGEPGAGKTTTLHHLALNAAKICLANPKTEPFPLLLHLPRWDQETTFENFVRKNWRFETDPLQLVSQGKIQLYLDGLNEMGADGVRKARLLHEWLHSQETLPKVIITCRVRDYIGDFDLELPVVVIQDMNIQQIEQFIINYLGDKAEQFLKQIQLEQRTSGTSNLSQLARNPYLLAALIFVYLNNSNGELPRNHGALFRQLARALWERERKKGTPGWIAFERMEKLFSHLAFAIVEESRPIDVPIAYALEHIGNQELLYAGLSANLLSINENQVRFYHQLMQEYFAAVMLGKQGLRRVLERRDFDYDWDINLNFQKWGQVVISKCGITSNADAIIRQLLSIDVFLAAHCIDTGISLSNNVRRIVTLRLLEGLSNLGSSIAVDFLSSMSIAHYYQLGGIWMVWRELLRKLKGKIPPQYQSVIQERPELLFLKYRPFMHALSKTGDYLAAEVLVKYLSEHDDFIIRDDASIGLRFIKTQFAVTALKNALDALGVRQEDRTYFEVISTLMSIQDDAIVPIALSLLCSKDPKKRRHAMDLFPIVENSPVFVPGLHRALIDESRFVREQAAMKLKELGVKDR